MKTKKIRSIFSLIPISIGGGLFLGILTIAPVMAFLDFLIPGGFHSSFEEFYLRWALVCTIFSFLYFFKNQTS